MPPLDCPLAPLGDNLVLLLDLPGTALPSGLYIPQAAKAHSSKATVLAAGPGRLLPDGTRLPPPFAPGDRVFIGQFRGEYVTHDGTEYRIIGAEHVGAKWEGE